MTGAERSLLSFLDTPILVGDPDGFAAYVNPAFEACFQVEGEGVVGRPLAELFEGGGREAILNAVAEVCQYGESKRFRVRERGVGYAAAASPIVAGDDRVGVVVLLKEEVEGVERLIALHREIQDPLDELDASLESLVDQTGGRRDENHRSAVEDALRAVQRLRKWAEQVSAVLCGGPSAGRVSEEVDPARLLQDVSRRVGRQVQAARTELEVLSAGSLPRLRADGTQLEAVLVRLVRDRLEAKPEPTRMLLGARALACGESSWMLLSIVECSAQGGFPAALSPGPLAKEVIASCGGAIHVCSDPVVGRATVIRLPLGAPAQD